MGIFDRFPYSSTHEMNLDFMLGKATEIAEDMQTVTSGMAQVQAGLSAISEKTEQATQAAAQAAQSASSIEGSVTAAEEAAEEAQMHNESAQTWANNAMTYKADCQRSATEAAASSSSAAQAATAAAASEDTVAQYAQAANASAQSAANNNDSAHQYANQASASASNATFHSSNAQTAATNANTSATNAETAATNAQTAAAQAAATKTDVETLVESLPEDFTDLNNTVNQLSDEIGVVKSTLVSERTASGTLVKIKGTTMTPIVVTGHGESETVYVTSSNLFDVSLIPDRSGLIVNHGTYLTITQNSSGDRVNCLKKLSELCPQIKVGDTVFIKADTTGSNKYVYFNLNSQMVVFGQSFVVTQNYLDSFMYFLASGASTSADISNIMVCFSSDDEYEPYNSVTYASGQTYLENAVNYIFGASGRLLMVSYDGLKFDALQSEIDAINSYWHPDMSMFENIGVIGDSFASGYMGVTSATKYEQSWPQVMARKHGISAYNYSYSGQTARGWCTTDSRGLSAMLADTAKNLYIIALGLNDAYVLSQDATYLGSDADMSQNDYDQNPNTFYGCMGRIIRNIQVNKPNAKIVLVTTPYGTYNDHAGAVNRASDVSINNAIVAIAEHFSLPVIITLNDPLFYSAEYKNNILTYGLHPTATMYSAMANAYAKMIGKAMVTYDSYFANYNTQQ